MMIFEVGTDEKSLKDAKGCILNQFETMFCFQVGTVIKTRTLNGAF